VTTIGDYAFSNCYILTSITIPNSVTTIGDGAFSCCSSLTSIDVDANNQEYSSIDGVLYDKLQTKLIFCPVGKSGEVIIPNSVTAIEGSLFAGCSNLTSINIPSSVTTIGSWAFDGCSSLASIDIPNSVTTIESGTFYNCSSLTSITIPNSVTAIGDAAFAGCSKLTSITSLAVTPPECGIYVFKYISGQACTLYVPKGSKMAYQQAPQWGDFVNIEEIGVDGIEAVEAVADGAAEVFNLAGVKVADSTEGLPAGIYLVREGSTVRKVIVK